MKDKKNMAGVEISDKNILREVYQNAGESAAPGKLYNLLLEYTPKDSADKKEYLTAKNYFIEELNKYLLFLRKTADSVEGKSFRNKGTAVKIFNEKFDNITEAGDLLEQKIDCAATKKKLKKFFREAISPWAYESEIARRGFEKPLGYAGDYKTIEMFYDQMSEMKGIGYFFDMFVLNNPLAKADIYRKNKMVQLIKKFIVKSADDKISIVNFGCGGCKDIRDLLKGFAPDKKVDFLAVDQDLEALAFAKDALNSLPKNVSIKFYPQNVIELVRNYRNKDMEEPFANKQLVYSIGLVDYFSDNALCLFVRACLKMLAPNGKFIFAHKNTEKRKSFFAADWLCDWRFYQRDKNQVLAVLKDEIKGYDLKVEWEKTHHMFFFILTPKR